MYGLTLIAVLAVMGGIIAYIGDKLGTKVGKRKLTIFGLRPKHTSILMTIITGIIIAASTLTILSLASRDVRTALFGMEALKTQLTSLSREVAAQNNELEASRAALEAKTKEYSELTTKIRETSAKLTQVTGELSAAIAERDRTAAALAQVQGDLTKSQAEINALQATKTELDAKVTALNDSKTQLQKDVDELSSLATQLNRNLQIVRQGNVVYQAGEVLSTTVIKSGRSRAEVNDLLHAFLGETNQAILGRLGVQDKNQQALVVSQENLDKKAEQIADSPDDLIVRVSAFGNVVFGERVPGWIEIFPNRLVYSSGDVVYTDVVDAGTTTRQAEEAVFNFLQQVNIRAVQQGVLRDPLRGTVGTMDPLRVYDVVSQVSRSGGRVQLTAVTAKAIYTAGPLEIEIRVRAQ